MFRNERLDEQNGFVRIYPASQQVKNHSLGIGSQFRRIVRHRDRMQVYDSVDTLMRILKRNPILDRAEVVADVHLGGWLNTRKYSRGHIQIPLIFLVVR